MSDHEHDVQMDADTDMHDTFEETQEEPQEEVPPTSPPSEAMDEPVPDAPEEDAPEEKPKRKPKPSDPLAREQGKSLFPVSRVQRVLKADKDLPIVSREAVLLISLATEEFVKRISEASHRLAVREGRATVQRKDMASVCRRADEFLFLEELIPLYEPEAAGRRKPKALQPKDDDRPATMLDQFVSRPKDTEDQEAAETIGYEDDQAGMEDVLMHEDGTMTG
ncbi:histone-fold-containing protein [Phanerochaete sordida]|uniref:Histone-fold-containing protein n=1 Tax=Phanerochaete sordida TaxID=48140 RepID=A0A9P3LA12_9APHY|nr:histone-fold-containing protein [Phanerochaete sordida]